MQVARIGSTFGAAMDASRQNARLRAAEKRVARQWSLWRQAMRKQCVRHSWRQRLDASIDPAFACAACVMLVWLLHKWL
jgi:hypothetical protein